MSESIKFDLNSNGFIPMKLIPSLVNLTFLNIEARERLESKRKLYEFLRTRHGGIFIALKKDNAKVPKTDFDIESIERWTEQKDERKFFSMLIPREGK